MGVVDTEGRFAELDWIATPEASFVHGFAPCWSAARMTRLRRHCFIKKNRSKSVRRRIPIASNASIVAMPKAYPKRCAEYATPPCSEMVFPNCPNKSSPTKMRTRTIPGTSMMLKKNKTRTRERGQSAANAPVAAAMAPLAPIIGAGSSIHSPSAATIAPAR